MKNDNKQPEMEHHERIKERHERIRKYHHRMRNRSKRVIVKGYMRPDGTSYYVVIPKEVREQFNLKGGEYFLIRPRPRLNEISLKLAKFVEEEPSSSTTD